MAGQVIGVVSAGDASIDARNHSEDVDIETGDAFADNFANPFVGLSVTSVNVDISTDFESSTAVNQQEGDNDASLSQAANASTGDGVGGQVIGSVTSAGGSADVVADNASEDADVETGDAFAGNFSGAFVGLSFTTVSVDITVDFESSTATANQQEGNNTLDLNQTAAASSGDGVAGQVIGAVSAGDVSIDARNRSEDVEVETGNAFADNFDGSFVGLSAASVNLDIVVTPDFESSTAINQQEGDNALDLNQTAAASTGDGVGGQVIGAVTSADGSADIVADNASEDVDVETGDAIASNFSGSFVGLNYLALNATITFLDFENSSAVNQQEGNNALDVMQTADASSGDGVAGQVIGAVSAGDASIDARNRSEDVDVSTGDAVADNFADSFVGLDFSSVDVDIVSEGDFESSTAVNQQEGDNNASLSQTANASSGDAVGGQVIGVVTSAGGSADAVLDNASEDVDAETGGSFFENDDTLFVGLNIGTAPVFLVL